jgi:ankyrin repeat protein
MGTMSRTPRRRLLISCALLAPIALAVAIAPRLHAHETDQFTTPPGREFADLGEPLSLWFYQILDKAVARANADIEARIKELGPAVDLSEFHTQEYIVPIVNGQIPWAMDVIEGWEREIHSQGVRDKYPGRVVAFKEPFKNIMQHTHFFLDPRQLWRLFLSSTMKANGVHFGTDKIGHFTDMGMNYWREYNKAIREGKTEDEAVRRAIRLGSHGLILSERGMLGYMTAGAYSNADMASNYLGLMFYRNVTEPIVLKGETRPPMLLLDGPYWRLAPHVSKETNFFAWFVSDHWDEALNPSHYESGMREKIREAVRKRRSLVLERYLDEHGNRRPAEWFDAKGNELRTYWGAEYGHVGQYDEFVSLGNTCAAQPPKTDKSPLALHFAAARGEPEQIRSLVSSGGDVNAVERTDETFSSDWGNRPLHWAARNGNAETVATLVEAGADVKAANDRGVTPLHRAVRHPKIAELLLDKGAPTDAPDLRGHGPLHYAARDTSEDSSETIATLLKRGAGANDRDREGRTPLHLAAKAGNARAVKALLAAGADVNAKDHFGVTPLHVAASAGNADVAEALVAGGASAIALDDFGCTPLHDAAQGGSDAVATMLIKAGADPQVADSHGTRPLEIARRHHHDSVARLLQRGLPTQTVSNELLRNQE